MSGPIVVIDSSEVRPGKLDELKTVITELVEFVESNESRPIVYSVYLNEGGTLMTVIQVHPDSASMEFHMKAAGPIFAKFVELIRLSRMDIYGSPSQELLEQLRHKARMRGTAGTVEHDLCAGFVRFRTPA